MFGHINKGTRSKPFAVLRPSGSATPSTPGMLTPPGITRDGMDYVFTEGTYVGRSSRARAYLLNGISVSGRVSGGRFTPTASETGRLLVYRETIGGSAGSIVRQASVVIPGEMPSNVAPEMTGGSLQVVA